MKTHYFFWVSLLITCSIFFLGFTSWNAAANDGAIQPEPTAQPAPVLTKEGVILNLPQKASQKEIGEEVYRLVCSACHAYDGSGLTDEWRATWDPKDQNCWQSKCHGYNHPEDGFYLPYSPPIVGAFFPQLFPTARDLYTYLDATMPWHNPGILPEDQLWAVTAHVLVLNGYDPGELLNAQNAAGFHLTFKSTAESKPTVSTPFEVLAATSTLTAAPPPAANRANSFINSPILLYGLIAFLTLGGLGLILLRMKR